MRFRGRPAPSWLLLAVLGQLSVRAVLGGAALLIASDGALVGLSTAQLAGTPFGNFAVPGFLLLVAFGLLPAVVCYAIYARYHWGWLASVAVALALLLWVLVELRVGFERPTVYLNLATAGAILALAVHPAVRLAGRAPTRT